ncbi:hypothetical protein [Umezawaea beigongshangensis]|uniref:hypothetical protein n=1 Tax=Umezawaea beigongshangensis TaxID=2780383 RepID=UPI0018F21895|nr:hypothetical protein [Umezawaea beigongshangensis]
MADVRWVAAVAGPRFADGTAAHLDAAVLSAVDRSGLVADLVCTGVDRSRTVTATAVFARTTAPGGDPAAFTALLDGRPCAVDPVAAGARCVRFPGQDALSGVVPAAAIPAESAVDEVLGVGVRVERDAPVDTRDFLRPVFLDGRLVLLVEPGAGGVLRPVEIADPHQCCGGH